MMPILKNIVGLMSNVTIPMLLSYIETTYPNMTISQITETENKNEYHFVLKSDVK